MFWKKKKPKKQPDIRQQAAEIAKEKRAEIGEEALNDIRKAIMAQENSATEKAKRQIMAGDTDKLRDNLKFWMEEK